MLEKLKTYARITGLWAIARRYFINNFYDGMLTVLGILLGFFVILLKGSINSVESNLVILTSLGSSISMFISGLTGSYLSERAEQKKMKIVLDKAMALNETGNNKQNAISNIEEIEKSMLINVKRRKILRKKNLTIEERKSIRTIQDRAERYATIIVAIVNGGSPFLGGIVPLIPFLFVSSANLLIFIYSFLTVLAFIIMLGTFLGLISRESMIKNIFQMIFAFLITILISIFFLG
jgi:predicted membrane protein (TIGR00267 family)